MIANNKTKIDDKKIIIEAKDLCKSYGEGEGEIKILKEISISIKYGDFVTISGASGVGKSTLLHLFGLLDKPTSGRLFFRGVDQEVLSSNKKALLRNTAIGLIFQFFHLLPEFSSLENVLLPALINKNGLDLNKKEKLAKELLDKVGLSHRLKHRPSELSGGEQQRVAIARALINEPDVILADEPTGNLDSESSDGITSLLKSLNRDFGYSIVVVTHNRDLAEIGSKKFSMIDGRLM